MMRFAGQAQYRRSRLNSNVRLRRKQCVRTIEPHAPTPSCRRPSTRVHCARPGVNVRAVLGHSGGALNHCKHSYSTAEDKVADIGRNNIAHVAVRPFKLPAALSPAAVRLPCAHDGWRRGSSDFGMSATARERTHRVACARQGDSSSVRQVAARGHSSAEPLREGQVQSQGRGTQHERPGG
jgi:hypothetical protein